MMDQWTVLVTGPIGRTDEYAEAARIAEWSANCLELIAVYPRSLKLSDESEAFDVICITSKHAEAALRKLPEGLRSAPVAVVGVATSALVERAGFAPYGEPARNAKDLSESLKSEFPSGARVLWLRGSLSDELAQNLRESGFEVSDPIVYETLSSPESERPIRLRGTDAILFTSPSAVQVFARFQSQTAELSSTIAVAIGTTTADALREAALGFSEIAVMKEPTPAEFAAQLTRISSRP